MHYGKKLEDVLLFYNIVAVCWFLWLTTRPRYVFYYRGYFLYMSYIYYICLTCNFYKSEKFSILIYKVWKVKYLRDQM
jgi:hypothetical protein